MIGEILIFLITFILAYFLYAYKKIHKRFDKCDVKYLPGVPIFGNVYKSTFQKRHMFDDLDEVYKAFPEERYVGYVEASTPIIVIRDPELIKQITVKDFDHFVDHRQFFPETVEPLIGGSVLMMRGERWRNMRTTLSPAFTGSKMRHMMPFMSEISANIIEYFKESISPNEDLDVNDLARRYTNDVIASAGFGLQVNSLKDKENDFYKLGQDMFKFGAAQKMCLFLAGSYPNLAKRLNISIFPERTTSFFKEIVSNTIEFREKNNVERPDMIQLIMEASKGNLKHTITEENDNVGFATVEEVLKPQGNSKKWSLNELTSQIFIFFVAGFESAATALVMCIHELTINPDIQEKLYQEIKTFSETKGKLSYENINDLKYLDCVLNESMRRWAAAMFMDRVCTKTYDLPPPREGGKPYTLKPGDYIYNVVRSLHLDPQYYPEPHKFNPDRFSDENKHNIKQFTYMPFGMGPRNCIGSRFALLEIKVLLYNMVLNFKLVKGPKTSDPIILDPYEFNIKAVGGSFIRLEARK